MQENIYELRAHHGMCVCFFKGKGYSDEFTAHMSKIVTQLQAGATVRLVAETDIVCEKCPKNQSGICQTADLVKEYDGQVLARCGLQEGTVIPFADFQKLVLERIIHAGEREKICGNCQWNDICR